MPLQNNIGPTIRALRAQRNVSQEKLALETGIGRRYMSDIENGRRNVSLETIEKLAGFFEISASELVRRIEQADMPPLTIDSLKDYLCELGHEDAVVLESPDYLSAVAGVSEDGRVIYSYPRMLEHLVLNDGMTYEEAAEFIDYNTIGSLPCMGVPRLGWPLCHPGAAGDRVHPSLGRAILQGAPCALCTPAPLLQRSLATRVSAPRGHYP